MIFYIPLTLNVYSKWPPCHLLSQFSTQEMVKFSQYIVAKFFEKLPKNPVLLAELVIWKTAGDCYEIEEGYGSLALR